MYNNFFEKYNFIVAENLYKISGRNKKEGKAFCRKIAAYRKATQTEIDSLYLLGVSPCYYVELEGEINTCQLSDIIQNPDIIDSIAGTIYKINIKGEN